MGSKNLKLSVVCVYVNMTKTRKTFYIYLAESCKENKVHPQIMKGSFNIKRNDFMVMTIFLAWKLSPTSTQH